MSMTNKIPEILKQLDPAVRAALVRGAQKVSEDAKERVPVRSGRLRDAIHWEIDEDGVSVIAGDREAFYGHIVEHGSAAYGTPAHPFLLPALEDHRDDIVEDMAAALRGIVG